MRVTVNGVGIYAYYTADQDAVRLRLSVDEWDGLLLSEGQRVTLGLSGQPPQRLLVTAATHAPPFVWVDLEPSAARVAG